MSFFFHTVYLAVAHVLGVVDMDFQLVVSTVPVSSLLCPCLVALLYTKMLSKQLAQTYLLENLRDYKEKTGHTPVSAMCFVLPSVLMEK